MSNLDKITERIEAILAKAEAMSPAKVVPATPTIKKRLQIGDMVSFTYDDMPYKGCIEYASDESNMYTVRVYAEANGCYEPTDILYDIPIASNIAMIVDEGYSKGAFATFMSKDGITLGVIMEYNSETITVEIIDEYKGETVYTGIEVTHPKEVFLLTNPVEVKDRDHKILAKLRDFKMQIEDVDGQNIGVIEGYASTYGNTDLGGDIIKRGAFTQTLAHKNGKTILLFDHGYKTKDIAGVAYLTDNDKGLMLRGELPLEDAEVASQYRKLKFVVERGVGMGLSIGYNAKNKNMLSDGRRELTEIALEEVSITPFPMNTEAQITNAKSRRLIFASKSLLWQQLDAPIGSPKEEGDTESLVLDLKTATRKILFT